MPNEIETEAVIMAIAFATQKSYLERASQTALLATQTALTSLDNPNQFDQQVLETDLNIEKARFIRSHTTQFLKALYERGITLAPLDQAAAILKCLDSKPEPTVILEPTNTQQVETAVITDSPVNSHRGRQRLYDLNMKEALTLRVMTDTEADDSNWMYPSFKQAKQMAYAEELATIVGEQSQLIYLDQRSGPFKSTRDSIVRKIAYKLENPSVVTPTLDHLLEEIMRNPIYNRLGIDHLDMILNRSKTYAQLKTELASSLTSNGAGTLTQHFDVQQTSPINEPAENNGSSNGNQTQHIDTPNNTVNGPVFLNGTEKIDSGEFRDLVFPGQVNLFNRAFEFDMTTHRLVYPDQDALVKAAYASLFRKTHSKDVVMRHAAKDLVAISRTIQIGRQTPEESLPEKFVERLKKIGPDSIFSCLSAQEIGLFIGRNPQIIKLFYERIGYPDGSLDDNNDLDTEKQKTIRIIPVDLEIDPSSIRDLRLDSLELSALTQAICDFGREGLYQLGILVELDKWGKIQKMPTDPKRLKAALEKDPNICAQLQPKLAIILESYSGRLVNSSPTARILLGFIEEYKITPDMLQKIIAACKV